MTFCEIGIPNIMLKVVKIHEIDNLPYTSERPEMLKFHNSRTIDSYRQVLCIIPT